MKEIISLNSNKNGLRWIIMHKLKNIFLLLILGQLFLCYITSVPSKVVSGVIFSGRVKSKTEKLALAGSLVSVHRLRPRTGLVGPVLV